MIDILMKAPLFQHVSSEAISGFLEKIPYRIESYQEHDIVALQFILLYIYMLAKNITNSINQIKSPCQF